MATKTKAVKVVSSVDRPDNDSVEAPQLFSAGAKRKRQLGLDAGTTSSQVREENLGKAAFTSVHEVAARPKGKSKKLSQPTKAAAERPESVNEEPEAALLVSDRQKGARVLSEEEPNDLLADGGGSIQELPEEPRARFDKLGLSEWLVATCREMGMRVATPVQKACIPAILGKQHVVGISQTGSGKTAAYALPILEMLAQDPYGVFALVLTPTRELAMQIGEQFRALGSGARLRDAVVIGGEEMVAQAQKLARRPHVVIATPGRLRDHLTSDPGMSKVFSGAKFLVLDEADRLLDGGFEKEMRIILEAVPGQRQTLLFSATLTTNLQALEELGMGRKVFHYETGQGLPTIPATLKQHYCFVPANVKEVYLVHLMKTLQEKDVRSAIIFASTCRTCRLLSQTLAELGVAVAELHSLQSQGRRMAALARFRTAQVPVLVATDVASRGLDIPTVDLVVNYDLPRFTRDYVHRVGRTARAGRGGVAVSLVTQYDVGLVHAIEALIGRQLEEYAVDEDDVLKGITKVFKAKRAALLQATESGFDDLAKARKEANRKAKSKAQRQKDSRHVVSPGES